MTKNKVRAIAFYLPQFYPTPENDKWWGPGFTEWTNVARARPLFEGHYQPRLPGLLGFYDLRLPLVREQQVELAAKAGIEGFCYWHYWFGNGKRLLDDVFREVVESGKPDFPFCLCWANHSWYNKIWNPEVPDKLLIEQTYPGVKDFMEHFHEMLPAFKDRRYMRVNGKLLFGFFEPAGFDVALFMKIWDDLAKKHDLGGFHFFDFSYGMWNYNTINHRLFDSSVLDVLFDTFNNRTQKEFNKKRILTTKVRPLHIASYNDYVQTAIKLFKQNPLVYPCIIPGFDHSPRSGNRGHILYDSTPELWGGLVREIVEMLSYRPFEENLLFVKAWNEWGEGNYLEPDIKYGEKYLEELSKALKGQ